MLTSIALAMAFVIQDPVAAPPPAPPPPLPPKDSIWDRLSLYADGRLRGESTFDQLNGEDRHRGRMRFRMGGIYEVTEDVTAEARLSTASDGGDANNPHWDFGDGVDGFNGANVVMDRFFLDWNATQGLDLRGGKFPNALSSPPVFGEFIWDADIQPAGMAAVWAPKDAESRATYDLRAVMYTAVEVSADADPSMFGVQGNLYVKAGDKTKLQFSGGYSNWSSLNPGAGVLSNQGNTDVTGDFGIVDGFIVSTWEGGPLNRTQAFVQAMKNVEDDNDEDQGFAFGGQLGTSGHKGDMNFFGAFYDLDANAVFSPPAQDDTPIAGTGIGTGMDGVILGGQYYFTDNFAVKLWYLTSDVDASDEPYRVRLDFDFKIK